MHHKSINQIKLKTKFSYNNFSYKLFCFISGKLREERKSHKMACKENEKMKLQLEAFQVSNPETFLIFLEMLKKIDL